MDNLLTPKIKIKAFKYPNLIHYEWEGELIEATDEYIIVHCKPNRVLKHYTKKKNITMENDSIEFFSLKEWFTVAIGIEDKKITTYYCNVAMPSKFINNEIHFVDLDLDYIQERGEWKVVDEDEFLENQIKYHYPNELVKKTEEKLELLKLKVKERYFPFNITNEWIKEKL